MDAWAAGLFEGEGHIGRTPQGSPRLVIKMTDEDVVRRFARWAGVGNVCKPGGSAVRGNRKQPYVWTTAKRKEVERLLLLILPYLGRRRRAAALTALENIRLREQPAIQIEGQP